MDRSPWRRERRAFERLIDFIIERLDRDPALHVYHYAPYEPTALKRLMGRYGTREDEVDRLLRGGVMVDLLRAVRQSLRASVESYSIKRIEPLYGFEREVDLRDAGSSIVAFEEWLELGEGERPAANHLERIERYNRDDVVSNARLRDWLEGRRAELQELTGLEVPRPAARDGLLPQKLNDAQIRIQALVDALTDAPADEAERTVEQQATWLLGHLLGWHRREDKSMWWEFFHWMLEMAPDELIDESEPIGGLEPVELLEDHGNGKQTWRYRFPVQEFDLGRDKVHDPGKAKAHPDASPFSWSAGDVVATDAAAGTLDLKRVASDPHPEAVAPLNFLRTGDQQAALVAIGEWVRDHGIDGPGLHAAARDLLLRRPPRAGQRAGDPLVLPGETDLDAARRLATELRDTTLAIQGPPGSGKTYTGARMICTLLAGRKARRESPRTSHKVIGNLLAEVLKAAAAEGVDVRPVQKADKDQLLDDPRVTKAKDTADVRARLDDGRANLATGTSWLWASDKMADAVDVLFVDEAGQISLANVLAMSPGDREHRAARRPAATGPAAQRHASARRRPLGTGARARRPRHDASPRWACSSSGPGASTRTLCAYTSEVFYDGRLEPEPHLAGQRVIAPNPVGGTGPRFVHVVTTGFDNESPPEAAAVADLARSLVEGGTHWIDQHGDRHPMRLGGRPDRRPVQRPGRRDQAAPPARRPSRDRRQVPGPGGAGQHLLDDHVDARGRTSRHGLPLQPEPPERRDVACPVRRDRRRLPGPASGARSQPAPDASRERAVPAGRGGRGTVVGTRERACACAGAGRPFGRAPDALGGPRLRSWPARSQAVPSSRTTHSTRTRAQSTTSPIGTCSLAACAARTSPGPKITVGVAPSLTSSRMSAP